MVSMFLSIILLIVLIGINGIFSASELAFLSLDKVVVKKEIEKGDKKAISINKILADSSTFLSTIQIGITLAGFLASAFAADYFADYFFKIINISFISPSVLRTILVVLITIILSYFTLVFGELVPKKIAINNPYKIAKMFVNIINVVRVVFHPLIKFLTFSTELICKLLRIKEKDNTITEEDIKKMIILSKDEGIIEEKEKEYILNIFKFNDIDVSEVMTPKKDVVLIDINDPLKKSILKIKETKFSRYPVFSKNENNIIGIFNVKDFILEKRKNEDIVLKDIVRPIHTFSKNEKIDDVFRKMQELNESLCAIYDNKNFVGIVTIEDAVEEIVGNIYDEYDKLNEK